MGTHSLWFECSTRRVSEEHRTLPGWPERHDMVGKMGKIVTGEGYTRDPVEVALVKALTL